jgi:hypothetical protein
MATKSDTETIEHYRNEAIRYHDDLWVNDGNIADMRAAIDRCRKEVQL